MANLSLKHIYKIYPGGVRAVSDFNLDIDDKEFIVFVGPSGCGKSTTLRMIAGLEDISSGELYIDDLLVNDMEPKDRDIAMVFQNYALYPHMTVYDNMAFGLRLRHMPVEEIDKRVQEAAEVLGIKQLLMRRPKALSGGQRQRVALGRAIVREPKVFLLDEPLSNLDAKLRVQMRTEITKIHHRLQTTFIYVTHDQTEAMTMGTRIVVMKDGIVQQVDTPTSLYDNPANKFVACFLGSPQMNIFESRLYTRNGNLYASVGEGGEIRVPMSKERRLLDKSFVDSGKTVLMGIRPEDIRYEQALVEANPESIVESTVDVIENLGNETMLYMNIPGKDDYVISRVNARYKFTQGEKVKMYFASDHVHFFDPETELTLMGVPDYIKVKSVMRAEREGLVVRFGETAVPLSASEVSRLIDFSFINKEVELGLAPAKFSLVDRGGDVAITGRVAFTDAYPRFKAVYLDVEGKDDGYLIVNYPLDAPVEGGDIVTVYYSPADIQLFAASDRLMSRLTLPTNNAMALVSIKDNVATIKIGKAKFEMTTNDQINEKFIQNQVAAAAANGISERDARCLVYINPKSVSLYTPPVKGEAPAPEYSNTVIGTLSGVITELDEYGTSATVFISANGFDNNMFVCHLDNLKGYNVGDRIRVCLHEDGVIGGGAPDIDKLLLEKSSETSTYVYVPTKSIKTKAETKAETKADEKPAPQEVPNEEAATSDVEAPVEKENNAEAEEKPAKKPAAKSTAKTAAKPAAKKTTPKKTGK